jgi:hypothetical protein
MSVPLPEHVEPLVIVWLVVVGVPVLPAVERLVLLEGRAVLEAARKVIVALAEVVAAADRRAPLAAHGARQLCAARH